MNSEIENNSFSLILVYFPVLSHPPIQTVHNIQCFSVYTLYVILTH